MIKLSRSLWIMALIAGAFACSEDDPLPLPTLDFSNAIAEVGVEVMFDNKTTNADRYEWKFGDGQSSTEVSPVVTFDQPGSVKVVLKAFTKDGQVDSLVRNITVRQRVLVGYSVNIYPTKNDGAEWDAAEAGEEVYPDLLIQLLVDTGNSSPTQAQLDNALFDGIFNNTSVSNFSRGEGDTGFQEDIVLTDEDWGFALFDFDDGDPNITTDDDFEFMTGVIFNPVRAPTFKNNAGDGGFLSVFFSEGGVTFDFDLYFELR